MENMSTVILACSSLYHRDPKEMQEHILAALRKLPETTDTVLVAMGYCGGSWEGVEAPAG